MHLSHRVVAPDALSSLPHVLFLHELGEKLMLVYDPLTWLIAGEKITHYLPKHELVTHAFGREPRATLENAQALIAATAEDVTGFIAIGSGTINDIVKYAAHELKKPYLCIATAASMNGYTSSNASLEVNNHKKSFPATPPVAVIGDITIITAAPRRLARAGLGDTLCRSSVEIDTMLSHYLLGTPYPQELFDRQRHHEPDLLHMSIQLTNKDVDDMTPFFTKLMDALLDAGDAMTRSGTSAVASQSEHMIAHTAELMYGSETMRSLHGEVIAVTSITASNLQKHMMLGTPVVKSLPRQGSLFLRVFGKYAAEELEAQYAKKVFTQSQVNELNAILAKRWPEMKQAMTDIALSPLTLDRVLVSAGVPTRPVDIRLDPERYNHAVTYAHMARDRFTFLDLAAMNDRRA